MTTWYVHLFKFYPFKKNPKLKLRGASLKNKMTVSNHNSKLNDSETCLIRHALGEKVCFGIDRVSDYTVYKTHRKGYVRQHRDTNYTG